MPRPAVWLVFALGMACVAYDPVGTSTAQQKTDPKAPAKVEPKQPPKVEPKAQPKPPDPKAQPKPPEPTEPEVPAIDGPPSPLELVRGLRQEGQSDLAVELIAELEAKSDTPAAVKAELPLERARCLLEAADDEPDEATRLGLVGEAKDGFATFLRNTPGHPRAAEAYLALARLTSLEAKAQLAKARRIDVPPENEKGHDEELAKQKAEAAAARPLFLGAAKQFKSAADKLGAQLAANVDTNTRRALILSKVDAELASAVNQMYLGDTYIAATAEEKKERSKTIDQARNEFKELAAGAGVPGRVGWVAKAWMAECEFQKDNNKVSEAQFQDVLKAAGGDSDDGKRLAKFFLIRHKVIEGDDKAVEKDARAWLSQYGLNRKAAGEAVAVRWYLATVRQREADQLVAKVPVPKGSKAVPPTPATALPAYREAEKLYRVIAQSDNEFTFRAQKRRFYVVRRLLGEAELPPTAYKTFEEAQMASLIQMAKLQDQLRADSPAGEAALKERRNKIVGLLEHAREIATEKDNPADVNEVLLRLIYFYTETDQAGRAAILGEHLARQVRGTGGKSSAGGALGVRAYINAAASIRITEAEPAAAARQADRDRAIKLARFVDERFPTETATDQARHMLASLLYDEGKPVEAYDASLKVRQGYERLPYVRLFQGAVATQLLAPLKDSPLPDARRTDVFRRTVADLEKLPPPPATANEDDARTFVSVRARLAFLYLLQKRIDPEAEKNEVGYTRAARTAEEAAKLIGTYKSLMAGDKGPNLDGWEAFLTTEDSRTRAVFLEGTDLFAAGKYEEVFGAAGKMLTEMNEKGPLAEQVKAVAAIDPDEEKANKDPDKAQKVKVTKLADGVDKLRRDLLVLGLKTRIQQGQADNGIQLFELLKKFGGSVETNQRTLEQLTTDMSGRIEALRKAGKAPEAQALSGAFGKLVERISAEPNLPTPMMLFLGQALVVVGEYDKAVETLAKVPRPANLGAPPADDAARVAAAQFRRAALDTARAQRMAKKFDPAEKLLAEAVGTKEKQGWAYSSLDFRKEACYLAEARGAETKDAKEANKHWGTAVKGWNELQAIARNRLTAPPPKDMNGQVDNNKVQQNKNAFYDAYFDSNRCVLKANMQLLAGNPKLDDTMGRIAKLFVDLEQKEGANMYAEVKNRYHELLTEVPPLRQKYEAAGGKLFLQATEN
ncbi:MAG: hypothetical protein U0804_07975 [Gemmataceae bacterium]